MKFTSLYWSMGYEAQREYDCVQETTTTNEVRPLQIGLFFPAESHVKLAYSRLQDTIELCTKTHQNRFSDLGLNA